MSYEVRDPDGKVIGRGCATIEGLRNQPHYRGRPRNEAEKNKVEKFYQDLEKLTDTTIISFTEEKLARGKVDPVHVHTLLRTYFMDDASFVEVAGCKWFIDAVYKGYPAFGDKLDSHFEIKRAKDLGGLWDKLEKTFNARGHSNK